VSFSVWHFAAVDVANFGEMTENMEVVIGAIS
jgi:hypothetical protein